MAACISSGALAAKPSSPHALAWSRSSIITSNNGGNKKTMMSPGARNNNNNNNNNNNVSRRRSRRVAVTTRAAATDLPDDQRVVITGAGVVSTAGNDRETFFDTLLAGTSGVIDLTEWKPGVFDDLPTRIGAPIQNLDYGDDLTAKEARRMDRVHQYAVCAGKRALRDAGLWGDDLDGKEGGFRAVPCGIHSFVHSIRFARLHKSNHYKSKQHAKPTLLTHEVMLHITTSVVRSFVTRAGGH